MTRLIRASEIGTFAFCERAWGYSARGEVSEQQPEIEAGRDYHTRLLRIVPVSMAIRRIGFACVALAVGALAMAVAR